MRKLFILLSFIVLTISTYAEDNITFLKATALDVTKDGKWQGWTPLVDEIPIIINFQRKTVIIYYTNDDGEETPQRIDYVYLKEYKFSGGIYYTSIATDNEYNAINMDLYLYDDGTIILKLYYDRYTGFKFKLKII